MIKHLITRIRLKNISKKLAESMTMCEAIAYGSNTVKNLCYDLYISEPENDKTKTLYNLAKDASFLANDAMARLKRCQKYLEEGNAVDAYSNSKIATQQLIESEKLNNKIMQATANKTDIAL